MIPGGLNLPAGTPSLNATPGDQLAGRATGNCTDI